MLDNKGARTLPLSQILRASAGFLFFVGCLLLVGKLDTQAILHAARSANPMYLSIALALNLGYLVARGFRWWLIVRSVSPGFALLQGLRISTIGVFAASIYPALSEFSRLVLLRRHSVTAPRAATAIVAERLTDVLLVVLLFGIGMNYFPMAPLSISVHLSPQMLVAGGGVVLVAVLFAFFAIRHIAADETGKLRQRVLVTTRGLSSFFREATQATRELVGCPRFGAEIAISSICVNLLSVGVGWSTLLAFDSHVSITVGLFLTVVIYFGLAVLPAPFGLGLYQAAGLVALASTWPSPEMAIAAASSLQAVNYASALVGVCVAVLFVRKEREPRLTARGSDIEPQSEPVPGDIG